VSKESDALFDERAQVAAEAKLADAMRLQRQREMDDFKWLMGHKQGRRIMWRMLEMTGLHRTPHVLGASAEDNAFRAGLANMGLILQAEIHTVCPEHFPTMTKEHLEWLSKIQQ